MCGLGVPVGCKMKHAKGLFQRPIRRIHVWPRGGHKKPLMCGLGVAVGCRMKHAKSLGCLLAAR